MRRASRRAARPRACVAFESWGRQRHPTRARCPRCPPRRGAAVVRVRRGPPAVARPRSGLKRITVRFSRARAARPRDARRTARRPARARAAPGSAPDTRSHRCLRRLRRRHATSRHDPPSSYFIRFPPRAEPRSTASGSHPESPYGYGAVVRGAPMITVPMLHQSLPAGQSSIRLRLRHSMRPNHRLRSCHHPLHRLPCWCYTR